VTPPLPFIALTENQFHIPCPPCRLQIRSPCGPPYASSSVACQRCSHHHTAPLEVAAAAAAAAVMSGMQAAAAATHKQCDSLLLHRQIQTKIPLLFYKEPRITATRKCTASFGKLNGRCCCCCCEGGSRARGCRHSKKCRRRLACNESRPLHVTRHASHVTGHRSPSLMKRFPSLAACLPLLCIGGLYQGLYQGVISGGYIRGLKGKMKSASMPVKLTCCCCCCCC
jgi:hypothetical protein